MGAVAWSLLLVTGMEASAASGPRAFFPEHSTVVLLCGLPGDVESENTYRDQLQRWVELASGAQAAKVVVLCDSPDAAWSNQAPVMFLKNDRQTFQGLGTTLAGSTNPVTVIAWGHGGKQGSTNVFHVRGPRITAADFRAVAKGIGEGESRWVLMFPGSGAFATQLAGEHREILSSECDTMFTSDPVEMGLLLKVARDKPELSFEAVGNELGKLTADWYQTRSLARTEEPTLWKAGEKPEMLAAGLETNSLSSVEAPDTNTTKQAETTTTELPASWKEIKKVEAQKYPDADGVVLRRRSSFTFGSNPAVSSETDEYIQILTVEGKRLADFDISYAPPYEDINFLDCEILRPDGKLLRLDPDAIREGADSSVGDYHRGQRKFFSLPGAGPGAVLHVRYRTEWKTFPMPHVSMEIPVDQELPAVDTVVEATVPKETPLHFALDGVPAADPAIKQTQYGTTYRWHFENLPARGEDVLTAPRMRAQGVQISTFPDWGAFAEWYGRISKLTDEVTPEIEAKAKELTRDAKTDREKVLAIFNYVTRLRYVAVPMGVNSYRPHAASSVFQNQFGDCKDKANLFNTLLHAVNIDAHLVLVPRFSQADDAVPGLSFNHAISTVKLGGDTLWVDTTDDVCRFGMLPPGDPGRKVLVVDGRTTLTQLPLPNAKDHSLTIRGEVDASQPMEGIPFTLEVRASGFPDYELRQTRRETREHGASLPLLNAKFRPVAGSFALEKQSSSSVAALDENFSWQAAGTWVGGTSTLGGAMVLRAPFWLPKEWDMALNSRSEGLFLNQGYPLTLDEEFEIRLPGGAKPGPLPGVIQNETEPLRWRIEWAKLSDEKLAARLHVELAKGEFSASETPGAQKELRKLLEAMGGGVSVTGAK